ncbi:right-handed parallel beta-helix repeat-containing protein [Methanococcoides sp.]|uniref:right-handed parallel beta-helix repeat-containing protein n=1 Tax=Methanococcoides sp. TaxID=1966350 RepID=UPI00272DD6D3|nr:right-handed parallel beta-helix repeat-containing protein [Methanococcoides sp.]
MALSTTASANDYYVATWGDDAHTGLTHEQSVRSLDHALSLMGTGDTLYMSDGTWYGEVLDFVGHDLGGTSGNPVTVKAYDGNPTLSNGPSQANMIDTSYQDWITIDGITVINGYQGYHASWNSHLVIRNSTFSNMRMDGINFWRQVSDTLVENTVVTNCGEHGIHYYNQLDEEIMYNHVIRNNDISNSGHNLIDLHTRISNVIVENNELYFTYDYSGLEQVGLYLHNGDTDNITIRNNYFHDQPRPLEIFNSEDVVIEYNKFEDISGRALMLSSFSDESYEKNARVFNIYFRNNVIDNADYGVMFWGEDSIYQNIYFINNTLLNIGYSDFYIHSGTFKNPIILEDNLPREQSKTFTFRVYPSEAISLIDSSNAIMASDDESITVCDVDASSIKVESIDAYLTINTYPIYAHPTTGHVNVEVYKYDTSLPQGEILVDFTAKSTDGGSVVFTVDDLQPNHCYDIKMDGVDFTSKQADPSGQIQFTSSEWSREHSFSVQETTYSSYFSTTADAGSDSYIVLG